MNDSIAEKIVPRFRIAPTPSGFLHHGNITAFLFTWACCKALGGKLLLRIDDLDQLRYRPEYLDDIFRKLDYYKIDFDEGPSGPDQFHTVWSQIHRLEQYKDIIIRLQKTGLLYRCSCSRSEIADGKECRCRDSKSNAEPYALKIATGNLPEIHWDDRISGVNNVDLHQSIPDFVIQKKDRFPSYQVASLSDDIQFGITHIVRGNDLIHSTAAQLFLADTLHEYTFRKICFYHHPLILSSHGIKLSKSAGDGKYLHKTDPSGLPDVSHVIQDICRWIDLPPNIATINELISALKIKFNT